MVEGHHLQLQHHPQLFQKFKQFNIKTVLVHHTVIQNEVDELLAKETIELYTGGAGFHCNVFVVPKHMGDL